MIFSTNSYGFVHDLAQIADHRIACSGAAYPPTPQDIARPHCANPPCGFMPRTCMAFCSPQRLSDATGVICGKLMGNRRAAG
jgi:hypothetical protein